MSIRSFALAGAALVALTAGLSVAQADEQDEEVRRLNLEQLEKARAGAAATAPAPTMQEGQGGPEFKQPPAPDEGMTDDEPAADEPEAEDEEPGTDDPATDDEPASPPE